MFLPVSKKAEEKELKKEKSVEGEDSVEPDEKKPKLDVDEEANESPKEPEDK